MGDTARTVTIPRPDDWHVHLRDGDLLHAVAPSTSTAFRFGLVMPNLAPPITSTAAAVAYRDRIRAALPDGHGGFTPLMTLYCNDDCNADDLASGLDAGNVTALKYYPAGATTNSDHGGSSLEDHLDLLDVLATRGARLLVHAESTDPDIDIFDREAHFLDTELRPICERMPELNVTVEHVSTALGVDFVRAHPRVVASVTPHHLTRDRSHLLGSGLHPDLYCKPVINTPTDRAALVDAVTSGDPSFFLGTDSAPHPSRDKYAPVAKAGIFNAPHALEVVADVFWQAGALEHLGAFTSVNGAAAYGYGPAVETVTLRRHDDEGDSGETSRFTTRLELDDGDHVVVFGNPEADRWTVENS